jgi:hypothetical protein
LIRKLKVNALLSVGAMLLASAAVAAAAPSRRPARAPGDRSTTSAAHPRHPYPNRTRCTQRHPHPRRPVAEQGLTGEVPAGLGDAEMRLCLFGGHVADRVDVGGGASDRQAE